MRVPPAEAFAARLGRLDAVLASRGVDALLVTSLPNVAYLSGLFASAAAVIATPGRLRLVTDTRYRQALEARAAEWPGLAPVIVPQGSSYDAVIASELAALAGTRVAFEDHDLPVRRLRWLEAQRRTMTMPELVAGDDFVESLRVVKDDWERRTLADAGARLSDVAKCILPNALAGTAERELAAIIENAMRAAGFEKPAFDTIVASGPHAARPHHRAGDRRFEAGDVVVVDFGGMFDGYAVDMTRTITIGPADGRTHRMIDAVAEAQAAAMAAVAPGARPEDVDMAARRVLARAGLAEAFTHGTGHGLGLEVHERPRIGPARRGAPESPLARGMVFTIEPGVYIEGWGGARIEDDVAVSETGVERLTDATSV